MPEKTIDSAEEAADAARALRRLGPANVAVKLGALGCVAAGEGIDEAVTAFAVEAVDTTAAGDTFNAALAAGLSEGMDFSGAVRFANAAAAISVTRAGAQTSAPTRREVDDFLQRAPSQRLGG